MKALSSLLFLALLLTPASSGAATKADIIRLLPPGTPIAIIDQAPGGTLERLKAFTGEAPPEGGASPVDELFMLLGLEKAPAGLNVDGPAAVAMPQVPFPLLILSVTDYGLFLEGLRGGPPTEGSPPPAPPAPGIDALNLGGKPVFLRQEGDLVLMTPMALLLAQPAGGGGLGATLHPGEQEILELSGSFVRIDVAMLMAFLEPMLQQFPATAEQAVPAPLEGGDLTDDQKAQAMARKILRAEVDMLIAALRQVRSLSIGLESGVGGSTLRSVWVPQPGSAFAALLAEPGGTDGRDLLRYFDGGSFFTGVFSADMAAFKGVVRKITDFMLDSGIYGNAPDEREEWQKLIDMSFDMAGTRSAFTMGPSASGTALTMLAVAEVDDTEKMRDLMQDSMALTEKLIQSSPVMQEAGTMKMKIVAGSETHRGVPIDHMSFDMRLPEAESDPAFDAYMEKMFGGPSLDLWLAWHDGKMLASYYSPSPDSLKTLIDRVLDGIEGDLVASEGFRSATTSLPEKSGYLSYYSLPRMIEAFGTAAMGILPGDTPPVAFGIEKSSGFGSAWFGTDGTLRSETFMPEAELGNYRAMVGYFKTLGAAKRGDSAPTPR